MHKLDAHSCSSLVFKFLINNDRCQNQK
jgi:hypothetical protein